MKIRKAKLTDMDQLLVVFKEYEKANVSYLPKKYKSLRTTREPLDKKIKDALKIDLEAKNARFLVAVDDNKIIGYIFGEVVVSKHPLFKEPKIGDLADITVLSSYQGKGIATKLYNELLEWFKKKNCVFVTLNVKANNQAQEIYKKWGFDTLRHQMIKKI